MFQGNFLDMIRTSGGLAFQKKNVGLTSSRPYENPHIDYEEGEVL